MRMLQTMNAHLLIRWLKLLVVTIVFCIAPARADDDNWPQFRGPFASGISPTTGPLKWDVATSKNIRWNVPIPGLGHSSPIVWQDRIFLTTAVAVEDDQQKLK